MQHLSWWHLSISAISQLLLARFWPNFKGRFLGPFWTYPNCHSDIFKKYSPPKNVAEKRILLQKNLPNSKFQRKKWIQKMFAEKNVCLKNFAKKMFCKKNFAIEIFWKKNKQLAENILPKKILPKKIPSKKMFCQKKIFAKKEIFCT